jgi:hypothetical protein
MVDDHLGEPFAKSVHDVRCEGRQSATAGQGVADHGDMLDRTARPAAAPVRTGRLKDGANLSEHACASFPYVDPREMMLRRNSFIGFGRGSQNSQPSHRPESPGEWPARWKQKRDARIIRRAAERSAVLLDIRSL